MINGNNRAGQTDPDPDEGWYTANESMAKRRKKKLDREWHQDMTKYNFLVGLKRAEMLMRWQHERETKESDPELDMKWLTDYVESLKSYR